MTKFQHAVIKVVQMIPPGKVVSYGQVALYVGLPRAAREVGYALRGLNELAEIPWWRVINNAGVISIKGNLNASADMQRDLLKKEGVEINNKYELDIKKYRWLASKADLKSLMLDDNYITLVLKKYSLQSKLL